MNLFLRALLNKRGSFFFKLLRAAWGVGNRQAKTKGRFTNFFGKEVDNNEKILYNIL